MVHGGRSGVDQRSEVSAAISRLPQVRRKASDRNHRAQRIDAAGRTEFASAQPLVALPPGALSLRFAAAGTLATEIDVLRGRPPQTGMPHLADAEFCGIT